MMASVSDLAFFFGWSFAICSVVNEQRSSHKKNPISHIVTPDPFGLVCNGKSSDSMFGVDGCDCWIHTQSFMDSGIGTICHDSSVCFYTGCRAIIVSWYRLFSRYDPLGKCNTASVDVFDTGCVSRSNLS